MYYTTTSCADSLYVSVPLVLHHSASVSVLKKLANYFSKEATVIDQNDISRSSHGKVPLVLQHASAQSYLSAVKAWVTYGQGLIIFINFFLW